MRAPLHTFLLESWNGVSDSVIKHICRSTQTVFALLYSKSVLRLPDIPQNISYVISIFQTIKKRLLLHYLVTLLIGNGNPFIYNFYSPLKEDNNYFWKKCTSTWLTKYSVIKGNSKEQNCSSVQLLYNNNYWISKFIDCILRRS